MKRHILHIYDYMTTHKAVACCILLALLAIGLWRSGTLHYLEDISSFLPQNEDTRKYTGAFRRLGGDDKISLLFTPVPARSESGRPVEAYDADVVRFWM